jgi:sugar phosphate isomerase/epimerase
MTITRRSFFQQAGLLSAAAMLPSKAAFAWPDRVLPGLQLWAVKDQLEKDFPGTLKAVGKIGYRRVEAAGWYDKTPAQFRSACTAAALDCYSAHYSMGDLIDDTEGRLRFARDVGATYVVASSPKPQRALAPGRDWVRAIAEAMTLQDWHVNAEAMNRIADRAKAMGLRFAYHNHPAEFLDYDGHLAFEELLRLTNPATVAFELDIGWVAAAGRDPVHVLHEHGSRIQLLHIKDIVTHARRPGRIAEDLMTVPVGRGSIDWKAVFRAARSARVAGWFVEQEPPVVQPSLLSARQSFQYLKPLSI